MSEVEKRRLSRGMRWLLIISVAFNLLVVAFLTAGIFAGKSMMSKRGHDRHSAFLLMRALDPEDRREIFQERKERNGRDPKGSTNAQYIALLETEPFDADALRDALDGARSSLQQRSQTISDALVTKIEEMTPEERRAYVARIKELDEKFKKRRRHRDEHSN